VTAGVMSYVFKADDGTTVMHAYNSRMELIAELVENGNDWVLYVDGQEFRVSGEGCKDPVEFIERMVAPPRLADPEFSWLMCFAHPTGETWEVYPAD